MDREQEGEHSSEQTADSVHEPAAANTPPPNHRRDSRPPAPPREIRPEVRTERVETRTESRVETHRDVVGETFRWLALAAGIALGGWLAGRGLERSRAGVRYVTVKGISEREARADLAIWPIRLVSADNDLARAHARLQRDVVQVRDFLARQGVDTTQIALQDFSVADAATNQYAQGDRVTSRYVIHQTMVVRSTQPETVLAASQHVAELVSAGVVLSSGEEYRGGGPTFIFTGLSKFKPQMIAEATARAREAAEQFARDSRNEVGGIRQASQGVFEILPRDQAEGINEASQIVKTVRVVSTIDYLLRD